MSQLSFTDAEYGIKRKQTRREIFLAEMDRVVPWKEIEDLIEPVYPKAGNGRRPYELSAMVRIHFMQQWYGLSDPAMEEALYEIASMRRFAGLSLAKGSVPDETTILNFRHLLENNGLSAQIFAAVNSYLASRGLRLSKGTIVDATIIAAPSSIKNASGKRDPEMHQTKKGNQWFFGMKAHIGVDAQTGLVHSIEGTAANVHDITQTESLLHGSETEVFADAGYCGIEKRLPVKVNWHIAMRPGKRRMLTELQSDQIRERIEQLKASVRSKVEHPFRVIKRQFGFTKVRYRGLAKNTAQLHTLFALSNLWMARRHILFTG